MRASPIVLLTAALLLCAAACTRGESEEQAPLPGAADEQPFSAIAADERLRFVGTEPFWGGEVTGTNLEYSTPEQPDGTMLTVARFAGRGGLSFSGALAGRALDMTVTPGACNDGMSDRTYPFTITLQLGDEMRTGCGWTDAAPYTELPAG